MQKAFVFMACLVLATSSVHAQQRTRTGLNHIALYVHDLKKSSDFYMHLLQLDSVAEPFHDGKHVWLSIGPAMALHLIEGAKDVTTHDKNSHICFSVPSVEAFVNRLTAAGVAYEDWPGKPNSVTLRPDGVHQIYLRDPDGWWVEVNDATK